MRQAYELHDSVSNKILGIVIVTNDIPTIHNEVFEGWDDFNRLEEHELDHKSVSDFVTWFNKNYVTQLEKLDIIIVRP